MFTLALAHVASHLMVDGKKYEIERFNISFAQWVDHRGQPQHEERGGRMVIGLSQVVDRNLHAWAKDSTLLKNGTVIFHTEIAQAAMRVEFFNAYCIGLDRETGSKTGTMTTLTLSPERVIINGVEHNNFWSK